MSYEQAIALYRNCGTRIRVSAYGSPYFGADGMRHDAHLHTTATMAYWMVVAHGRAEAQHFRGVGGIQ